MIPAANLSISGSTGYRDSRASFEDRIDANRIEAYLIRRLEARECPTCDWGRRAVLDRDLWKHTSRGVGADQLGREAARCFHSNAVQGAASSLPRVLPSR